MIKVQIFLYNDEEATGFGDKLRKMSLVNPDQFEKLYGSKHIAQEENKFLKSQETFIIHPYSLFKTMWDLIVAFALFYNLTVIPYKLAFFNHEEYYREKFIVEQIPWDFVFILDIIMTFYTGVIKDGIDSEVIIDPKTIRSTYLKGWFVVDVLAAFPFDVIFTAVSFLVERFFINETGVVSDNQGAFFDTFRLVKLLKFTTLVRILRVSKFMRILRQWEEVIDFQYDDMLMSIQIVNQLALIIGFSHFSGCLQYAVCVGKPDTWVTYRELDYSKPAFDRYVWSVFRAVSQMLCIGYGEYPPSQFAEIAMNILVKFFSFDIWGIPSHTHGYVHDFFLKIMVQKSTYLFSVYI